jgi:hypothetical protein
LQVCFTPLPRPGFALQGFSLPRSRTTFAAACPLAGCLGLPAGVAAGARKPSPAFRAFLCAGIRRDPPVISRCTARSPPELLLLRVFLRAPW